MMRRWVCWAVGLGILGLVLASSVDARRAEEKADETDAKSDVDLADLGTAFQLIEYSKEHKAPEALITAAGLLLTVAEAKLKDLDAKVELLDSDGKPVKDGAKSAGAAKINLKKEAKALLDEASVLALKQKGNVEGLIKEVGNRKPKTDSAGVVRCFVGSLGSKQTLVIPLKVNGSQITNLAIRANEALRVSVIRDDDKSTLGAMVTTGGNLPFQAKGDVMSRGVRRGVKVVIRKEKKVVKKVVIRKRVIRRDIGDGDCEVTIIIYNPGKEEADLNLFLN